MAIGGAPYFTMTGGANFSGTLPGGIPMGQGDPASMIQNMFSPQTLAAQAAAGGAFEAAQQQKQATIQAANAAAAASRYASDQQLAGINAQLGYKKSIFNQLFPEYQGLLTSIQSQGSGGGGGSVGLPTGGVTDINQLGGGSQAGSTGGTTAGNLGNVGGGTYGYGGNPADSAATAQKIGDYKPTVLAPPTLPTAPDITKAPPVPTFQQANLLNPQDKPVISDALLNQQINSAFAGNQQRAATDIQNSQNQFGGRGVGSNSPLAQSLQGQIQGSMIGANSAAAMAAQNNAAAQNAAYAQAMNQALIGQAASVYGSQTGLLGSEYATQTGGQTSEYNAQLQALLSGYGTQQGALTSQGNAYLQALQGMYGSQLGLQGQLGTAELGLQGQLGAAQMAANANIYGTNVGYQQAIQQANIQAQWEKQNAILSAMASAANI